jgi:uncharacterized membrane protein YfcA
VYLATEGQDLQPLLVPIAVAIAGVIAGTLFGGRVLSRIPEHRFRVVVAVIVAALGGTMLARATINIVDLR